MIKAIQDKIDKESKQAQKKVIKNAENLDAKKVLLEEAGKVHLEAERARGLNEKEIHLLWPQAVERPIADIKADQDQLMAYKAGAARIKMQKVI